MSTRSANRSFLAAVSHGFWILVILDTSTRHPEAAVTRDMRLGDVSGSGSSRGATFDSRDSTATQATIALKFWPGSRQQHTQRHEVATFATQKRLKVTPSATSTTTRARQNTSTASRLTQVDSDADTSQFEVVIDGSHLTHKLEDEYIVRTINCWFDAGSRAHGRHLEAEVISKQPRVVVPYPVGRHNRTALPLHPPTHARLRLQLNCSDNPSLVGIYTRTVGRADVELRVWSATSSERQPTVRTYTMSWAVTRNVRMADMTFDVVIPVLALIVCFSIGCASDLAMIRTHTRSFVALGVAVCCQFFLLPLVSDVTGQISCASLTLS